MLVLELTSKYHGDGVEEPDGTIDNYCFNQPISFFIS